jgi:4-amino-4-deoxy-L-arabinose transferase-like glycosyltransferase
MRTAEQPRQFAFQSPLPPEKMFAAARRPFLFLFAALVFAVAGMVRHWAGPAAGLLTAALVAFEPNLVAHAGVVHTDLAAALGFFGTIALSLLALERRSLLLWGLTGLALGLSLASKFSAVFLVPIVSVIALAGLLLERRRGNRRHDLLPLGARSGGSHLPAFLWGAYAVAMRSMAPSGRQPRYGSS